MLASLTTVAFCFQVPIWFLYSAMRTQPFDLALWQPFGVYPWQDYVSSSAGPWPITGVY